MLASAAFLGMVDAVSAQPTYVVDTGPGGATGGLSLTQNQYLAGQFTLDQGHEINGLEGWMIYPTVVGDLPVFAVLYGDDGGVPDLTNEIHRQLFLVPASGIPFAADWHGIGGLALPVYGGTPYWLAFEVPSGSFGSGAMPPTAIQELDSYAIDTGAGYLANSTARLGIRVLPEPGLAVTLANGACALAIAGARRRTSDERARVRSRIAGPALQ
jgi:hypothetical protein